MDRPNSAKDLASIAQQRKDHHHERFAIMDEIEAAIKGKLPHRFAEFFGEEEIRPEIRTLGTADHALTGFCAKEFPIYVNPKTQSEAKRKEAERVEKIAYAWNAGASFLGGPEMEQIMYALSKYQVRFFDGVLCVYPDFASKTLHFSVRDPRTHLPPIGWSPLSTHGLDETMFVYKETLGALKQRYPDKAKRLDAAYESSRYSSFGDSRPTDATVIEVGEYYSRNTWYVATLDKDDRGVVLVESNEGDRFHPGVCPVTSFQQFMWDPLFAGQVGLDVAANKAISQMFQATDQMLHGGLVGPKLLNDYDPTGYNVVDNAFGNTGQVQRMGPTSPLGLERYLGMIMSFSRTQNMNPESFQGGGEADSGKALDKLQAGPRAFITDVLWVPFISGFPKVYANCAVMEQKLWPNEKKTVTGKKGKTSFEVDYVPIQHLAGYEHRIKIEPGLGLGGFQMVLDLEQRKGAGLLSKRTFMEKVPDIRDAELELQRIEAESVDDLIRAVIEAKGPTLQLSGLLEVKRLIDEEEHSLGEAFRKVSDAGLLEAAPEAAPGGMPPGMPPELAAMMGGAEAGAPPPLELARGA